MRPPSPLPKSGRVGLGPSPVTKQRVSPPYRRIQAARFLTAYAALPLVTVLRPTLRCGEVPLGSAVLMYRRGSRPVRYMPGPLAKLLCAGFAKCKAA